MSRFDGIAGLVTTRVKFVKRFLEVYFWLSSREIGRQDFPVIYEYMIFLSLKRERRSTSLYRNMNSLINNRTFRYLLPIRTNSLISTSSTVHTLFIFPFTPFDTVPR